MESATDTPSPLHSQLLRLIEPVRELLQSTDYTPPESSVVSVKFTLLSLLPTTLGDLRTQVRDTALCFALLSSSPSSTSPHLSWIPNRLSVSAGDAFSGISRLVYCDSGWKESRTVSDLGLELSSVVEDDQRLVIDLLTDLLPVIKNQIKQSDEGDEVSAASAATPVVHAILAAHQLSWFVSRVQNPYLGKLCPLVIPYGLTALDHWSSEVKGQGMVTFIHLAKHVKACDLGCFVDVILDACCHNIVSTDEIWRLAVEMCVLCVTLTQRGNPRSPWIEKIMHEMIGHLERQPRDKDRRIAWLQLVDPFLQCIGLVLLAHFRRLFPLFFQWMHAADDESVLLVLKRMHTVVKVTWIRKTPHIQRLVDELVLIYKEAATRVAREEIRSHVHDILTLLQQCKDVQFEEAWEKYKDDPNLRVLGRSIGGKIAVSMHPNSYSGYKE